MHGAGRMIDLSHENRNLLILPYLSVEGRAKRNTRLNGTKRVEKKSGNGYIELRTY
jgi:hypothetical protein